MPNERAYLKEMLDSARRAVRYLAGRTFEDFAREEMCQDAVARRIGLIGRAASRVSTATRTRMPGLPWHSVVQTGVIVVDRYFEVAPATVWKVARDHLSQAIIALEEHLKARNEESRD